MYFYAVESLKKILLFLIAVIYLFLSTGVTMLQTHCLCSDSTSISFYSASGSCNESVSDHSCCEDEIYHNSIYTGHKVHDCGCDKPIVTYLKLTNHLDDNSELQYTAGKTLSLSQCMVTTLHKVINTAPDPIKYPDYSPPENSLYGRSLIAFLNQRKIALIA